MGDVPTQDEAREGREAAMVAALGMTRSRQLAEELVQDAFEAVFTTRPWSRAEKTFKYHVVGVVWSLASHAFKSKDAERDAEAHEGWHREDAGVTAPSPEARTLHRADEEQKQTDAEAELAALEASFDRGDLALRVLRCRRDDGLTKAAEIADRLGVAVAAVYRANEALRDHLKTVRKQRRNSDEAS